MALILNLNPDFGLSVQYEYENVSKSLYKGNEYINAQWIHPLAKYNFAMAYFEQSIYDYIASFYASVNGSQDTFLFIDPFDYNVTQPYYDGGHNILTRGVVREENGTFQLCKKYTFGTGQVESGLGAVYRPITRPYNVTLYNGSGVEVTSGFTIDNDTGVITDTGVGLTVDFTWSGNFYTPVRFDNDTIPIEIISFDTEDDVQRYALPDLRLIEVREEAIYIDQENHGDYNYNYSLPLEFGAGTDFQFLTDIFISPSGYEVRDDLQSDRRKLSFSYSFLTEGEKETLVALWRVMLGTYAAIRFTDSQANITNQLFRFTQSITFRTLSGDEQENYCLYTAEGLELVEETVTNKTTYCHLWSLHKKDGSVIRLTDHDVRVNFSGNVYEPNLSFSASASAATAKLVTDSTDINTVFVSGQVTEQEILTGQIDNASIEHYLVNWRTEGLIRTLFIGNVGSYSIGYKGSAGKQYSFESLSVSEKLNFSTSVNTSSTCSFEFLSQTSGGRDCNRTIDASVRVSATVSSATSTEITLDTSATPYLLGKLRFTSGLLSDKTYYIGDTDGNIAKLMFPLPTIPTNGTTVELTRRCGKLVTDCAGYSNLPNYGGFPQLPGNDATISPPEENGQ